MQGIRCNWYVFIVNHYMFRIKCEPYYINSLFKDKAITEYRKCESKEECAELCAIYNKKKRGK